MEDSLYERFVKRWEEVTDLPPQTLGPFTPYYKSVTSRFKVMPWPWLVVVGATITGALYVLLGSSISFLVTILQRGF